MSASTIRTTKEEQRIAELTISTFKETSKTIFKTPTKVVKIRVEEQENYVEIPAKAFSLFSDILSNMAEGKSVTIVPLDEALSTQQAANRLQVSRPHLVKLLEEGLIPFKKVGSHRRVAPKDLAQYEKAIKENREQQLDFLAKQAQILNLGY